MVDFWIIAIGSVITAVIAFLIAFNIISSVLNSQWKTESMRDFTRLYGTVESVCEREINNTMPVSVTFQSPVRMVYSIDDTKNLLKTVFFEIQNTQESKGQNLCLQFKDEDKLRCFPEPPNKLPCIVRAPHMGVLPENEDIFVKASKLLGKGVSRSYDLFVEKTGGKEVTVSIRGLETATPTTTSRLV